VSTIANDKQFEIAVAVTSAVAAMIPGLLLFWLEYRRDRERVRVRRVITFSCALVGQIEWWIDIAIQITNLSQFPITLTAAGYNLGGQDMYRGLPSLGYPFGPTKSRRPLRARQQDVVFWIANAIRYCKVLSYRLHSDK
jgi:hypothetical protein